MEGWKDGGGCGGGGGGGTQFLGGHFLELGPEPPDTPPLTRNRSRSNQKTLTGLFSALSLCHYSRLSIFPLVCVCVVTFLGLPFFLFSFQYLCHSVA